MGPFLTPVRMYLTADNWREDIYIGVLWGKDLILRLAVKFPRNNGLKLDSPNLLYKNPGKWFQDWTNPVIPDNIYGKN
jgi:hypothetical protein